MVIPYEKGTNAMYIWVTFFDKNFTSRGCMRFGLSKCKLVIRNFSFIDHLP